MTDGQVSKLVAVIAAAYPAAKGDAGTVAIYQRMLRDLDYVAASAAVERLIATNKWLPTVAEIREATLALDVGEVRPGGHAWGEVTREAMRICNLSDSEVTADPTVARPRIADAVAVEAARALGWLAIRNRLESDESAFRARFTDLYDKLAGQHRRAQLSESLPAMQRFRSLQASEADGRMLEAGAARPAADRLAASTPAAPGDQPDLVSDAGEFQALLAKLTGALTDETRAGTDDTQPQPKATT